MTVYKYTSGAASCCPTTPRAKLQPVCMSQHACSIAKAKIRDKLQEDGEMQTQTQQTIYTDWRVSSLRGMAILADAQRPGQVLGNKLSLVRDKHLMLFVHWTKPAQMRGKVASEEPAGHIKWSVRNPERPFLGCEVVQADMGMIMQKVPDYLRPQIPEPVAKLKLMYMASMRPAATLNVCAVCFKDAGAQRHKLGELRRRALCLITMHMECCKAVLMERHKVATGQESVLPPCPDHERVPAAFKDALCKLCSAWSLPVQAGHCKLQVRVVIC